MNNKYYREKLMYACREVVGMHGPVRSMFSLREYQLFVSQFRILDGDSGRAVPYSTQVWKYNNSQHRLDNYLKTIFIILYRETEAEKA